jgi:hypothetical protein
LQPRKFKTALFTYTMNILKIAVALALPLTAALAQTVFPQGRLTLTSNTPVMTSDVVGATTLYYTPYQGFLIPIATASNPVFSENEFNQLTLTLSSTGQTAGNIYDIFAFNNPNAGNAVTLAANCTPWPSLSSRGTSTAVAISQANGIWVNTYSTASGLFELCAGSTTFGGIGQYCATYLGSIYMTANGETGVSLKPSAASGGTNNVMGVYNAYNRVRVTAYCRDDTSSWNYSTASWRAADGASGNTNNKISFIDGLAQSPVTGNYSVMGYTSASTIGEYIGLNEDSSTTTPDIAAVMAGTGGANQYSVTETFYPLLGLHYIQAVEYASGTGTASFYGANASQQLMALAVTLDM